MKYLLWIVLTSFAHSESATLNSAASLSQTPAAPVSYSDRIRNFDVYADVWRRIHSEMETILLGCRVEMFPNARQHRRSIFDEYKQHLTRSGTNLTSEERDLDGGRFKGIARTAEEEVRSAFDSDGSNSCSGSFDSLRRGTIRRINILSAYPRLLSDLKRKFNDRHARISIERMPFGPIPTTGRGIACDSVYSRTMGELLERHQKIIGEIEGLRLKLEEDILRLEGFLTRVDQQRARCESLQVEGASDSRAREEICSRLRSCRSIYCSEEAYQTCLLGNSADPQENHQRIETCQFRAQYCRTAGCGQQAYRRCLRGESAE